MEAAIIAASASVAVAVITYLLTYLNSKRLSKWQDGLARTNAQLQQFYGPLLSLAETSERSWNLFREKYGLPDGGPEVDISQEHRDLWILWVTNVFQPANSQMLHIIVDRADLLIDNSVPPCLLDLCAHTSGYEVTIKQWQSGDYTDMYSIAYWPSGLLDYLRASFELLKRDQQRLIDKTTRRPAQATA